MIFTKKLTFTTIFLALSFFNAWCQTTIDGTVVLKSDNLPIPGIWILEKGTANKTTTNADGLFTLKLINPNSTLIFSGIGMRTQEYKLNGQEHLSIAMKEDCNIDFFDAQELNIYAKSGLIANPFGGQLDISSPYVFFGGVIKASYSYQTNGQKNNFQHTTVELSHFISNCDLNIDFIWNNKQVSSKNMLNTRSNSIEADLNIKNIKWIAGYGHLNLHRLDEANTENLPGLLVGLGKYLNMPFHPTATVQASLYKNRIEYEASIVGGNKKFICFLNYYKIDTFNELSLGIGMRMNYRINRHVQ